MATEWAEYAKRLKEILGLEGSPVAISFSLDPPKKATAKKCRVCNAFLQARDGQTVDLTAESSACPGGTWYLGLGDPPKGERARAHKEFLIDGEKLFCDLAVYFRSQSITGAQVPRGLADHVIFSPLEKSEQEPQLVLFICNPEQACRLVTLDLYTRGISPQLRMAGATCYQAVTYPLASGELNVSLMDYTSRRMPGYKASDMLVTVPYHRLHGIIRAIPRCTAGTAKMELPEAFRRELEADMAREIEG